MKKGKYIVIEGTDGCGKSTVQQAIINKLQSEAGLTVVSVNEPGSTALGQKIREIVIDASLPKTPLTELLLFTTARVEIARTILQQLDQGCWVVSSRNYLSSIVYQGLAGELGEAFVDDLSRQLLPVGYIETDLTIILDVDSEVAKKRRLNRDAAASYKDAFESRDELFQQKLIDGYRHLANSRNFPLISSNQTPEAITQQIYQIILERLL